MKREVQAAVNYLEHLVATRSHLDGKKIRFFVKKLQKLLCDKYTDHWYPDCPSKGQAYRCIRINNGLVCDDVLLNACKESGITVDELCLPPELTLWIDPLEVCARSKEHYRPYILAIFNKESPSVGAASPDHTSDYHSASSSACSSTSSSDNEEETKEERVNLEAAAAAEPYTVAMVPRVRRQFENGRIKYFRTMTLAPPQLYYKPAPTWSYYKRCPSVYYTVNTCEYFPPPPPPPPPPPQHVCGFHVRPHQPTQFVLPETFLHPWGPMMY